MFWRNFLTIGRGEPEYIRLLSILRSLIYSGSPCLQVLCLTGSTVKGVNLVSVLEVEVGALYLCLTQPNKDRIG